MMDRQCCSFSDECLDIGEKEISYLADKSRHFNPYEINVKEKFGVITDRFIGEENGPLVIHIKEGHFNKDSFVCGVKLIEEILSDYGINLILKESNSKDDIRYNYERYCYTRQKKVEMMQKDFGEHSYWADKYLYTMSSYPLDCRGVDNHHLRDSLLLCYGVLDPMRPAARQYLNRLKQEIEAIKPYFYHKELQKFEHMKRNCHNKTISINTWAMFLKRATRGCSKDLETRYPNFWRLLKVIDMEQEIFFHSIDDERDRALSYLNKTRDKEKRQEIHLVYSDFSKGNIPAAEFFAYLMAQYDNPETSERNLFLYTQYLQEFRLINTVDLFDETAALEEEVYQHLYENDDQKTLKEMAERCDLLLDLLDFSLQPRDYNLYISHREKFDIEAWQPFLSDKLIKMGGKELIHPPPGYQKDVYDKCAEFYAICIRRAYHFVDRTLAHIEHSRSNAGILVTGGFHSFSITRLLKQKNISYVVISPQIKSYSDENVKDKAFRREAKELVED